MPNSKHHTLLSILIIITIITQIIPQATAQSTWLTNYTHRTPINIQGQPGAGTGYQVNMTISLFDGLPANAVDNCSIPTYDGTGEAIHPSVVVFDSAWNGYKFWMAMTPFSGGDDTVENPSIVASNNGVDWVVPGALVNPIDTPASGHMSDTELFYDEDSNALWCYYRGVDAGPTQETVYRMQSTNGVTWTNKQTAYTQAWGGDADVLSESVIKVGSTYYMFVVDKVIGSDNVITRYQSNTGLAWSNPQNVTVYGSYLSGQEVWHIDVIYSEEYGAYIWLMVVVDDDGWENGNLMVGRSNDPLECYLHEGAFLSAGIASSWDDGWLYRPTGNLVNATVLDIWYTANNGTDTDTWGTGYTYIDLADTGKIALRSNGDLSDIRFTDNDYQTELAYWIVPQTDYENQTVWIKVADSLDVNRTIYTYYGTPTQTSKSSVTWVSTHNFGDYFTDNSRNTTLWDTYLVNTGAVAEANGRIESTVGSVADQAGYISAYSGDLNNTRTTVYLVRNVPDEVGIFLSNTKVTSSAMFAQANWYRVEYNGDGSRYTQRKVATVLTGIDTTVAAAPKTVDIVITGGDISFYENGVLFLTEAYALPSYTNYVCLFGRNAALAGTTYIDNFFTRKYIAVEPLFDTLGAEENYTPPTPPPSTPSTISDNMALGIIGVVPFVALILLTGALKYLQGGGNISTAAVGVVFVFVVVLAIASMIRGMGF